MQIKIKLGEALQDELRLGDSDGCLHINVPEASTATRVLAQLGADQQEKTLLVIINGANIPPSQRDSHPLAEGDEMIVMPPLKGG